ncbi:MAG: glycogen synthase GlgA [Proteobacteria bacterium]|nr:glycogen synthase GlgA [Pseudomonadota bacterium]
MNIVIVTPEVTPFSKTGGLADVCGALGKELVKLGHRVKTFSPFYKCVKDEKFEAVDTGNRVEIHLGGKTFLAEIWRSGDHYFIGEESFFFRDAFYGDGEKDYKDNALRFTFFSKATLETLITFGEKVDIVHCHDWQTGLIPYYLKKEYKVNKVLRNAASVFTIHNLAYQGLFPRSIMETIDLPASLFNHHQLEFYDELSFIKGGLVFADILTTVSKKYSLEIQEAYMGCGLESVLQKRKGDLFGIINGVDYDDWNPETDKLIPATYSARDLRGKRRCKRSLKKYFKLSGHADLPVIGMVSRLDSQKGFEIIEAAENGLMKLPLQFVFLGSGSKKIQAYLEDLADRYPDKVALHIGYSEALAHLIEAGSDLYLMPSRYEPCGLNHFYSLKYGTIPIVRATGGLDDAIINYSSSRKSGNGFKFRAFSSSSLVKTIKRAIDLYSNDKESWEKLQKSVMLEDRSWEKSIKKYDKLYRKVIEKHPISKKCDQRD